MKSAVWTIALQHWIRKNGRTVTAHQKTNKRNKGKMFAFSGHHPVPTGKTSRKRSIRIRCSIFQDMTADNISFGRLSSSQDNYIVVQPSPVTFFSALTPPSILAWSSLLCLSNYKNNCNKADSLSTEVFFPLCICRVLNWFYFGFFEFCLFLIKL